MNAAGPRLRLYGTRDLDALPQTRRLPPEVRLGIRTTAHVLPFRVSGYVVEELIDWDAVPDDPIFQLTFTQPAMLRGEDYDGLAELLARDAPAAEVRQRVDLIRRRLNPHPDGQLVANVPRLDGEPVPGVQHKYPETCLIFPSSGQTCHSYCTYCFRWPQFVGMPGMRFATDESRRFQSYVRHHREITDVLITGGDPMIMSASRLAAYIEPFLEPGFEHVQVIRIGTKSLSFWPYRFLTDRDSDDLLRLFDRVVSSGRHLALMAHFSHWRELETDAVRKAIARLLRTGVQVRTQAPLVAHVNDSAAVWARMWREQVRLGCVPYYCFVARETGAHEHFAVPLARAFRIFQAAFRQVSGLGRTVRGPSMSALPGKVLVEGIAEVAGERVFVLSFLQARDPQWCLRPFFARFDERATWFDQLRPAFGQDRFFYEDELAARLGQISGSSSGTSPRCSLTHSSE